MASELRKAGWTVTKSPALAVIDGEGDFWVRGEDNLYRLTDRGTGWPLEDIRRTYGLKEQA